MQLSYSSSVSERAVGIRVTVAAAANCLWGGNSYNKNDAKFSTNCRSFVAASNRLLKPRQVNNLVTGKIRKVGTRSVAKKPRLSEFATRLLARWLELQLDSDGQKVIVAVSGGADSTALLLAMDELIRAGRLSLDLVVAHLDHRMRKASKEDADWVQELCKKLNYNCVISTSNIRKRAKDSADNLEQAARRGRYCFLQKLAEEEHALLVLTAHTLDDQAETVLMRLLRGSAAEGLGGIESIRPIEGGSKVQLARPLVSWARRADTEQYCRGRRVRFRVDEMNSDERFVRVRVRRQLLPLMQTFNNKIVEAISRTASLLREDAAALSEQALLLLSQATEPGTGRGTAALNVSILARAQKAVRRRALRHWIANNQGHVRRLEMVHLVAVEKLLEGDRGRAVELPNGTKITRKSGRLYLSVTRPKRGVEKAPTDL